MAFLDEGVGSQNTLIVIVWGEESYIFICLFTAQKWLGVYGRRVVRNDSQLL